MATYDLTQGIPASIVTGDVLNCPYSGAVVTLTLPPGTYKLECWGGYGHYSTASPSSGHTYGYGGYAAGTITLSAAKELHIYVGGAATTTLSSSYYDGGWNGGGGKRQGSSYNDNGAGGGATDICLTASAVTRDSYGRYVRTEESYLSRLIVAGGGGAGRSNNAVSQGGYCPVSTTSVGYNASMTAAGNVSNASYYQKGGFGYGAASTMSSDDYASGGGGWYGGGGAGDSYGGGGSSFVWCDAYASYVPSGYTPTADLKMTDVSVLLGSANNSPSGATSNGYARITVIEAINGPDTPSDLTLTTQTYTELGFSWSAVQDATGYKVYKDGTLVSTQSGTSYTDTGLLPNETHTYGVCAYNNDGESDAATLTASTPDAYYYVGPVIHSAAFSVNPANINTQTVLSVNVTDEIVILEPVWVYSGQVYSGQIWGQL